MSIPTVSEISLPGWERIHKAAFCGDYNILLEELDNGVSPNLRANNLTSIYRPMFYPLLQKKREIYFDNMTPLYLAAQNCRMNCVKLLMERGANPRIKNLNKHFNTFEDALGISFWLGKIGPYLIMKRSPKDYVIHDTIPEPTISIENKPQSVYIFK